MTASLAAHEDQPGERRDADGGFDIVGVATAAGAHLVHDSYPAFLGTYLPYLIEKFDLSFGVAGALVTVLRTPLLFQPFLGYLADRSDIRYWVILPPTVTALTMSLLGVAPGYLALCVLLFAAGLSHAVFHPAGGAMATRLSGRSWGRGTSVFITGGELGRAIGPLFIAAVIQALGLEISWLAVIPGVIASLLLYWRLGRAPRASLKPSGSGLWAAMRSNQRPLLLLCSAIVVRMLGISSLATYYQTYLQQELGQSVVYGAMVLTVFELAGAGGALFGGTLSDRFGRRTTMAISQGIATPVLVAALLTPPGPLNVVLMAAAGATMLSAAPIQLALLQELMPQHRGTATGIMLFLGFEGTALGTFAAGLLADRYGLGNTLVWACGVSIVALPLVLALPRHEGNRIVAQH